MEENGGEHSDKYDNQSYNGGEGHLQEDVDGDFEEGNEEDEASIDHALIPESIKLMVNKYHAGVHKRQIQEEVIHKTVLIEFRKQGARSDKYGIELNPSSLVQTERQRVVLDEQGVVSILCIGIDQWVLKGEVSLGLSFDGVPGKRFINKNGYSFILMGEMHSSKPETVFVAKPDSWVKEHFPDLTPSKADTGMQLGPVKDRRLLPIIQDPRSHLFCPLGLFVKNWKEERGEHITYVQLDTIKVIALSIQDYNTMLKQFQEELKDTKLTVDLSAFSVKATPSRSDVHHYWGAVFLDIFYVRQ
jgi:hypothetical protein